MTKHRKTTKHYHEPGPRADFFLLPSNPVRRGLVKRAADWKWSSALWYATDGQEIDSDLPMIHGIPSEFFVG